MTVEANTVLISAEFTVKDTATGTSTFTVDEIAFSDAGGTVLDSSATGTDTNPASVSIVSELTGDQTITMGTKPAAGAGTGTVTATGTNFAVSFDNWQKDGGSAVTRFEASTSYTAIGTLTANSGYQFASVATVALAGGEADGTVTGASVSSDGSKLTFTYKYTTTALATPDTVTPPTANAITYGNALNTSTLSGGSVKNGGTDISGSWAWADGTVKPAVSDSGTTSYNVVFTPSGADAAVYAPVTKQITLAVNPKTLTDVAIADIADQSYTGSAIKPEPVVTTSQTIDSYALVKGTDYTVEYGANITIGSENGTVTVKMVSGGNYSFTDVTKKFNIVAAASTISITGDPDKEYDGTAVTDPAVNKSGSTGTVSYTYYTNAACTTETTTADGAASNGAAPKNAGNYWVRATVAADANYGSATSEAKAFTITPKSISDAIITLGTIPTYNGSEQQVTISSVIVDGLTLTTGDYDIVTGTDKNTNVASKDLKITGKGNFTGEATKSWSLEKATPVAGDFTITTDLTKNYTGNPITVTVPTSSKNGIGSRSVYYEGTGSTTYTKSETAPTNVGTYAVTFNVSEGTNYTAASGLNIGTLTINKVDYTGDKTASGTVRSGQITAHKTLTLPALPDGAIYAVSGTLGGSDTSLITDHSISGTTLTYSTASKAGGTSATITINVTGATNYNTYDVVVTITAEDKTELTISGVTMGESSYEYGGTPVSYNNEGLSVTCSTPFTFDNNTLEYIYSGTPDDGTTFTASTTAPTKAGSYTLTVRVPADNAAYTGEQVINFTISKKSVTITSLGASNKEYNGNDTATPTGTAVIDGKLEGDDVTIGTGGSAKFADKTVGTGKTVTFTGYDLSGTDAANYSLSGQPASVTANITAKSVTITGVTATNRAYAVGNTTVALTGGTVDGVVSGDTVTVDLSGATGMMENANVGNGKAVTVTGAALGGADAANYILSAQPTGVTVDISKAIYDGTKTGEISVPSTGSDNNRLILPALPEGAAYATGITLSPATKAGEADKTLFPSGGTTWSEDGNSLTFKTEPCPEGYKATMTFSVTGATNYENYNVIVTVKVVNKLSAALTVTQSDCTYGETLAEPGYTKPAGTIDSTIAVTYKGRDGTIYAESATKPTDAGNYEVTVKCETETHIYTGTSDFTINKATPTGTPTYTAITTSGKTLADAALTVGSIVPAGGSIAWDLGNSQTVSANTAYNWTYTPADPANYNNLTGSITPYVVSYSGGGGGGSYTPAYSVTVDKAENGSVTVSPKNASKGDTVTITVKPDEGYALDTLTITDKDGKAVTVTEKNGKYTFTMPASKVTVKATFAESEKPVVNPFVDVKEGDYFYDAVLWAVENGITEGTSATTFSPNAGCTRAQIVTFLWRAAGSPAPKSSENPFDDVKAGSYYYDAVLWAVEQGITKGTSASAFSPDTVCTRSQTVTLLYRAAGSPWTVGGNSFTDVSDSAYYNPAVQWAVEHGVTAGTGANTFSPDATCTRAQIVTFLYRNYQSK